MGILPGEARTRLPWERRQRGRSLSAKHAGAEVYRIIIIERGAACKAAPLGLIAEDAAQSLRLTRDISFPPSCRSWP